MHRREWLRRAGAWFAPPSLVACAAAIEEASRPAPLPAARAAGAVGPVAPLRPWRTVNGGFLAPPLPGVGLPPRPASGMFVRFMSPRAVALRGQDLLVADVGTQRLWRMDPWTNTVTGIPGVAVQAETALALGPELSAWVLDPAARQVLRFARDGRLLQTWRMPAELSTPVALALADGGATLLVADGAAAQWSEHRTASGIVTLVSPVDPGAQRIAGVDGLALARDGSVFVLDRHAGAVHRVRRDGRVLDTLGRGELRQPAAIAADRFDRVFVHDRFDDAVKVLHGGRPGERFAAAQLGVQRIAGLAVDERAIAVADAVAGQVVVLQFSAGAAP